MENTINQVSPELKKDPLFLIHCLESEADGQKLTGWHVNRVWASYGVCDFIIAGRGTANLKKIFIHLGMSEQAAHKKAKNIQTVFEEVKEDLFNHFPELAELRKEAQIIQDKYGKIGKIVRSKEARSVFVSIRMTPSERDKLNSWVHPKERAEYIRTCIGLNELTLVK